MGHKGDVFFLSLLEQLYPLKPEIILREREKMDLVELLLVNKVTGRLYK
jgi:hypothetical protein